MNRCIGTTWILVLWWARPCDCTVEKYKRCVEYKIPNYQRDDLILEQHASLSLDHCLFQCSRHPPCAATNVHINGTGCELLQASSTCEDTNHVQGWVFVSFSECYGAPPWLTIRPADSGWQWITADDPISQEGLVYMVDWRAHRFVSRVLYRGLYLPGWWKNDVGRFRTIDPLTNTVIKCASHGEFLSFTGATNYTWANFTSGDEVPHSAIIGGHGHDAIPLYVVKSVFSGPVILTGYYNPKSQASYMVYFGLQQPTTLQILLHDWHLDNNAINTQWLSKIWERIVHLVRRYAMYITPLSSFQRNKWI